MEKCNWRIEEGRVFGFEKAQSQIQVVAVEWLGSRNLEGCQKLAGG
jgi:hypothetical protein